MKTIVIGSQKGGSAKTTLVAHLAVEAVRAGDGPIWIIDTDQQGTLSQWHGKRKAETPERAEVAFASLASGLNSLDQKRGAEFCLIDTAPAASKENAAIFGLADLVLIPVRPSPNDLWAVGETVAVVKAAGVPFLFVVTQAKANANITAQTVAALSRHGQVAQSIIADRVPYAAAMAGGNTAAELAPKGLAAGEIAALWEEVKAVFAENSKEAKIERMAI